MYVCLLCNPCYDLYGSYGLKNDIQFVKGRLRSVTFISLVGQERVYTVCRSVRTVRIANWCVYITVRKLHLVYLVRLRLFSWQE